MKLRQLLSWPALSLVALVGAVDSTEAESSSPVPTRCIARWHKPSDTCRLPEPLSVEALGRDEEAARDLAMDRMLTAMDALRASHTWAAPDIMRAVVRLATQDCEEHLLSETIFTCFPEPHLKDARYCHLELPVALCASGQEFSVAGRAWRDGERARTELCGSITDGIDYLERDPQAAKACEAQCWQTSRLECGLY